VTESPQPNANVVAECLRSWNPKAVVEVIGIPGRNHDVVPRELLRATAKRCCTSANLQVQPPDRPTSEDRYLGEPRFDTELSPGFHPATGKSAIAGVARRPTIRLLIRLVPVWRAPTGWSGKFLISLGFRFTGHPTCGRILLPMIGRLSFAQRLSRRGLSRRAGHGGNYSGRAAHHDNRLKPQSEQQKQWSQHGPQHPSTHGVLRILLELDGETVVKAVPDLVISIRESKSRARTKRIPRPSRSTDRNDI